MDDVDGRKKLVPRLCHIVRWSDFVGYGFNLHAEKGKAGQFIGKVDEGSPAEAAGLKQGDRIVEVNGVNIGNENHQQVVGRIKAGGDETTLLVVDQETDQYYKEQKIVVREDLDEVLRLTALRDINDTPEQETNTRSEYNRESVAGSNGDALADYSLPDESLKHQPRLCNLCKWPDFDGYGFNLHAEKDKPGQYIGSIDPNSPAETGGLRENDRIIEVNGENIESLAHSAVIQKIKAGGDKTSMLVADQETDKFYKNRGQRISSSMPNVRVYTTPPRSSETARVPEPAQQEESAHEPEENGTEEVGALNEVAGHAVAETHETVVTADEAPVDLNAYEEVTITRSSPPPTDALDGTTSNGINGQNEVKNKVQSMPSEVPPSAAPHYDEPTAVIRSQTTTAVVDLNLNLTAAQMKEQLKARRKQDPRMVKQTFEQKHQMFEKL
ncbi:Na(+)/H(+) exchange regulatory cofactor NHE-RF1-like isoform X2 [Pomacea canaliculata]|uniref:Na(+)/H(+) exchange regulatory cofactor NHE-RF1-like isoform X2 n=1 Tax=Pomacea canaliculata TaxID=400727 RepID=UPI000D72A9D2|nr:Na(+)/H(+) exchange regulatory cofactor NHE-RF1-like isoform X2 [Pomacea canaliculata]